MAYFSSGTLAQVATVLAKEYGVRVKVGGSTAYTSRDENNKWFINIPALATNDPYYMDIMRCYLDHEAGHVRFSDMDLLKENKKDMTYILKSVWNIFEDVFIERKMSRSFSGCARNLRVGAERIFSDKSDSQEEASSAVLNYILMLARYNATKSAVFRDSIDSLSSIMPDDLKSVIDEHVAKLGSCNSTADTMDLAKKLCEALSKYVQDNSESDNSDDKSGSGGAASSADNGDENADGSDDDLGDIPQDSGTDSDDSGEANQQKPGGGAAKRSLSDYDLKEAILEALKADDEELSGGAFDIADKVNEILSNVQDECEDSIAGSRSDWPIYRTLDELLKVKQRKNYVGKLSDTEKSDALKESAKLASQLAGLLQTMVMNRGGFATRGKLDSRRIARIAVGRPDIFSSHVDKRGLDTEVIIAVDFSGSMCSHGYKDNVMSDRSKMTVANQALMSILLALKGIQGVRSMAYMYSNFVAHVCNFSDAFTRNSRMVISTDGSTPTGDAVQHAMTLFSPNAKRKILLLLTDGEPDDSSYFRASVKLLKQQGIEIVGVGILDDSLSRDMSADEHIIVNDLSELSPKLFKILRDKLVRNA